MTKTLDLETCSREDLVKRIQNQKIEIINMAKVQCRQLQECVRLSQKLDRIRKVMKEEFYNEAFKRSLFERQSDD
jgi:hypothetical protein